MELQGKKATHDFLSLYTKSSSFQQEDPTPPPQGFFLKTHDFLRPLERPAENGGPRDGETTTAASAAAAARVDVAVGGPTGRRGPAAVEHMLPGGMGIFNISHVPVEPLGGAPREGTPAVAVVKPEQRSSCGSGSAVGAVRDPFVGVRECCKPEPGYGHRSGYVGPYAAGAVEASPGAGWEDKDPAVGLRGGQAQRWSSLFAAGQATAVAGAASRHHSAPENRRFMEAATSRSSKGFDEEEDEDEERGRRDGSTSRKDLSIRVDGKGSGSDQRPNTPRSKHSATEQRRRSKINDRFQILRELIPHSDQKRDKASFLLEVIEYIRFLQEKVQKYESSFPAEWNQDTSKLMPWVKVYFRSFWKNARNNSQAHVDRLPDPSQVIKNGSASPYIFSGRFDESSIPVAPAMISSANNPSETDVSSGAVYKSMENASGFTNADNIASQDQSQWLRSGLDCAVSNQILSEQEELAIDKGTISVSAAYSQGLLSTLMQALQSSGIDLSQATVSVQINLGKRAMNKRNSAAAAAPSNNKDADPAQVAGFRASLEESSQAHKRQRVDNS